jgi:hypothetical protein
MTAAWPSSQTTADAIIGVDTCADTCADRLLDHMGRQVAEITEALSRSTLRERARRPCAFDATGYFGHKLLVTVSNHAETTVLAIDCAGGFA